MLWGQWFKLLPEMSVSHIRIWVLALLSIQIPTNVPGKAGGDGQSTWGPATHGGRSIWSSRLNLASVVIWEVNKQDGRCISLCLFTLPFEQINQLTNMQRPKQNKGFHHVPAYKKAQMWNPTRGKCTHETFCLLGPETLNICCWD